MEEEKNDNNSNFNISDENSFKQAKTKKSTSKSGIGKTVVVPFVSGVVGATLVIGTCFGVPNIKNKLISGTIQGTSYTSALASDGSRQTVNLSDFSGTSIAVAQKVLPSVVGIKVSYQLNTIFGSTTSDATGSGIIISEDGYILTNNHVISSESNSDYYSITEATGITISLYNDDTSYPATVVGSDSYTDLAVLKIDKTDLTPATLGNSDDIQVGEFVMAVGNPLGMDYSVTSGIVSAKDREITSNGTTYDVIQTDAAINSGNSGGALVNSNGEVIGINTLKLSGSDVEGMGFAIPISSTTSIVEQLIENKTVKRPYIGITSSNISEQISKRYNIPQGMYIEEIEENTSASKADLKVGDIITKINGTDIKTVNEFNKIKNKCNIGDKITVTLYRNNEYKDVEVTLMEQPESLNNNSNSTNSQSSSGNNQMQFPNSGNESIFDLFR